MLVTVYKYLNQYELTCGFTDNVTGETYLNLLTDNVSGEIFVDLIA